VVVGTLAGQLMWTPRRCAGDAMWDCTIVFSEDFSLNIGGQIVGCAEDGTANKTVTLPHGILTEKDHCITCQFRTELQIHLG